MSLLDIIPGYSTAKILTTHIQGEDLKDYAYCQVIASRCEASFLVAEKECRDCIDKIMWKGLGKVLPLCGGGFVKAAAGKGIQQLSKKLKKAAAKKAVKSAAGSLLGPIGVGIMVLSMADVLTALYKAIDIIQTADQARKKYCKCSSLGSD